MAIDPRTSRPDGQHEPRSATSAIELSPRDVRGIVEAGRYLLTKARERHQWLRPKFVTVSAEAVNQLKARFERGERLGPLERVDLATLHLANFAWIEQTLSHQYALMELGRADGKDVRLAMILASGLFRPLYALESLLGNDARMAGLANAYEDLLEPFVKNRNTARANRAEANKGRSQQADRKALKAATDWCSDHPLHNQKFAKLSLREQVETYLERGHPPRRRKERLQRMLSEGLPQRS